MIARDPAGASRTRYDLIVVGGGVHGIAVALESVARGMRPLLLERGDFGEETSRASLRILHGGLRDLQRADLRRFRDSVVQRRWWLRTFPDLVRPLRCLLPLRGERLDRPMIFRMALAMNDLLSWDRNRDVRADRVLLSSRIISADEASERFPVLGGETISGAALWYDASLERPHRVMIEMLRWAVAGGAVALNRLEATRVLMEGERTRGVRAVDRITGEAHEYRAPVVVDVAGAWAGRWGASEPADAVSLSVAFNLLVERSLSGEGALGVRDARSGQVYFLRPFGTKTLIGTGHLAWSGPPPSTVRGSIPVPEDRIAEFLSTVREALPGFAANPADVIETLWGFLPTPRAGSNRLTRHPRIRSGTRSGPKGMVRVSGVKFTGAPGVAIRTLDRAFGRGSRGPRAEFFSRPPEVRITPSPMDAEADFARDAESTRARFLELAAEESAMTAEDLVWRRLDWGLDPAEAASWLDRVGLPSASDLSMVTLQAGGGASRQEQGL